MSTSRIAYDPSARAYAGTSSSRTPRRGGIYDQVRLKPSSSVAAQSLTLVSDSPLE